jgi:hypothetical protein
MNDGYVNSGSNDDDDENEPTDVPEAKVEVVLSLPPPWLDRPLAL